MVFITLHILIVMPWRQSIETLRIAPCKARQQLNQSWCHRALFLHRTHSFPRCLAGSNRSTGALLPDKYMARHTHTKSTPREQLPDALSPFETRFAPILATRRVNLRTQETKTHTPPMECQRKRMATLCSLCRLAFSRTRPRWGRLLCSAFEATSGGIKLLTLKRNYVQSKNTHVARGKTLK